MINRIQSTTPAFNARLRLHPNTVVDEKVYEEFYKRTKNYPRLVLSQDGISKIGDDTFSLRQHDLNIMLFQDQASFTNNMPITVNEVVNRFVSIFEKIQRNAHNLAIRIEP